LLDDLKTRIRAAQVKAALAVNRELIQLYWDTGRIIVHRQERDGWGAELEAELGQPPLRKRKRKSSKSSG
jgi:hypothetical protein